MPAKKKYKKILKQSLKKRFHNLFYKNKIKKLTKEIKTFVLEKNLEKAKTTLSLLYKILDKAAKERVIKKKTASRKKSRVAKLIEKLKTKDQKIDG